jgi:nucleoid-associated protein YgaU
MYRHHYYVVQRGDTLSGIAYAYFGNANDYRYLASYNRLRNANHIIPGEVIWFD